MRSAHSGTVRKTTAAKLRLWFRPAGWDLTHDLRLISFVSLLQRLCLFCLSLSSPPSPHLSYASPGVSLSYLTTAAIYFCHNFLICPLPTSSTLILISLSRLTLPYPPGRCGRVFARFSHLSLENPACINDPSTFSFFAHLGCFLGGTKTGSLPLLHGGYIERILHGYQRKHGSATGGQWR